MVAHDLATETGAAPEAPRRATVRRLLRRVAPDALVALALGTVALVLRLNLPSDGLFYDDAWMAFAAAKGTLREFATAGQTQPGFTFVLLLLNRMFGSGTATMVAPALVAGALGPPALYLTLRRFRYSRSIGVLLAALLTVTTTHILLSDRVKSYTADLLIVLLLAVVVPQLAARTWRVWTATAWFVVAVSVASFSSFALLATVAAGIIVVLHPHGDRLLRVAAVAGQFVALAVLLAVVSRTYNGPNVVDFFDDRAAFIDFDLNPVRFVSEVIEHLVRVAYIFPGGPTWWATICIAVALVGLVATARRGPRALAARFFLLLLFLTFCGAVVRRVPFGPDVKAGRVTLWLIPAVAFGLAAALEFACSKIAAYTGRRAFDAFAVVAAVLVLLTTVGADYPYPRGGAQSATEEVMANLGPRDAVWITLPTTYSFALYADTAVGLRATPHRATGFLPKFFDERLHMLDWTVPTKEFNDSVRDADQVYVVNASLPLPDYVRTRYYLTLALALAGFERVSSTEIGTAGVDVWRR